VTIFQKIVVIDSIVFYCDCEWYFPCKK